MITLTNLTYTYPDAAAPALRAVTLHIRPGAFALVLGASGSGKSTLLRLLNGLVPHFSGGQISGSVSVAGLDPLALGTAALSRHVGFVFQDPEAQAVTDTVADEVAFALEHSGAPPALMRQRVAETLALLGLSALRERRLATLSGGERQRVALAAVLVLRPEVLVLDEPTSQLDPVSAEDLMVTLLRLNQELGLTIVLAEHRVERVLPFVDVAIQLEAGGTLRSGPPSMLLRASPFAPPLVRLADAFGWQPLPLTVAEAQRHAAAVTLPPAPPPPAPPSVAPVLELRGVSVRYGAQHALRGVDLALRPGELLGLLGRNGAGKTTLLRTVVGLLRPSAGQVLVNGQSTAALSVAAICRQVAYLPQDPSALLFAETVRAELEATLRNHGLLSAKHLRPSPAAAGAGVGVRAIEPLLDALGLSAFAERYPRDLSVGERQRVALAAVTITGPALLLLDEPTRGLDAVAKRGLAALLSGWRAAGAAILLVSHDTEFVAGIATRVALLTDGALTADGPPDALLGAGSPFATQTAQIFPGSGHLTLDTLIG